MQKGHAGLFVILLGILIGVSVTSGVYYYFNHKFDQRITVTDFESCAAAGNPIMESYPAQCNSKDGRHFVQQLSEAEKQKLVPPTKNATSQQTTDLKDYANSQLKLSLQYPSNWELLEPLHPVGEPIHTVFDLEPQNESDQKIHRKITLRYQENPNDLSIKEFAVTLNDQNCKLYSAEDAIVKAFNDIPVAYRSKGFCEPLGAQIYTWKLDKKIYQLIDFRVGDPEKMTSNDDILSNLFWSITVE